MYIHHVAIWTPDLERLCEFYQSFFNAQAGSRYSNPAKSYTSYFLTFADGARLEIMSNPSIAGRSDTPGLPVSGLAHLAISTGSAEQVDALTRRLQDAGYILAANPRWTGDGYYESVILDPDGNRVEITI